MQQALAGRHLQHLQAHQAPVKQQALACSHISRASRKRLRVAAAASTEAPEALAEDELSDEKKEISKLLNRPYKYGFKTYIESETFPKGLNEDVVRAISAKKGEPDWLLEFRLKAFRKWLTMEEPNWSDNRYPRIDYQNISYYSEPKMKEKKASLDEVDPELLKTFDKLVSNSSRAWACNWGFRVSHVAHRTCWQLLISSAAAHEHGMSSLLLLLLSRFRLVL